MFAALPFVSNWHWDYVVSQYLAGYHSLFASANLGSNEATHWAQVFNPIATFIGHVPNLAQTIVRVAAAFITLWLCYRAKQRYASRDFYTVLFGFATYLMLFNPRTENNDYIMLSAALALLGVWCVAQARYRLLLIGLVISVCTLFASNIGQLITPWNQSWFTPLMALVVFLGRAVLQLPVALSKQQLTQCPSD